MKPPVSTNNWHLYYTSRGYTRLPTMSQTGLLLSYSSYYQYLFGGETRVQTLPLIIITGSLLLQSPTSSPGFCFNPRAQADTDVRRFCAVVPQVFTSNRTVLIRIVSSQQLQSDTSTTESPAADSFGTIDGYYRSGGNNLQADGEIEVSSDLRGTKLSMVLAHEYGHFVWFERMTAAQRKAYREVWTKDKRSDQLVSTYATVSPREGFAEAFSWYIYRQRLLKQRDMRSWQFITHLASALKSK